MTFTIISILFTLAIIWIVGLFILPITFRISKFENENTNAKNWPGVIIMKRGVDVYGAIWAQEYYESKYKWKMFIVYIALRLLILLDKKWGWMERRMELMGHEIEVQAEQMLVGTPVDQSRAREARALTQYSVFEGYSADTIEMMMGQRWVSANDFVRDNWDLIQKKHLYK